MAIKGDELVPGKAKRRVRAAGRGTAKAGQVRAAPRSEKAAPAQDTAHVACGSASVSAAGDSPGFRKRSLRGRGR